MWLQPMNYQYPGTIIGVDETDLEWAFIGSSALAGTHTTNVVGLILFSRTIQQGYRLQPYTFDIFTGGSGAVFVRCRD